MWFWIFIFFIFGCSKEMPIPAYPERLPITEQAKEITKLPPYNGPVSEGQTVELEQDEGAPFSGILLSEEKAFAVANLRINYDETYRLASSNHRYMLALVTIQEKELYRADRIVAQKNLEIKKLRDSWWQRNKLWVGISGGLFAGILVCLATEKAVIAVAE